MIIAEYTVTVNDSGLHNSTAIQDYAGYKVFKSAQVFNYVKDTSVSVVTVKSAMVNKVVLNFSKPIKGSNISLYHTAKLSEAYKAEVITTDYADDITFTFNEALPVGTLNLFLVNSQINGEQITDSYGIPVSDQYLTCEVAIDTAAPVVKYCKVYTDESIKIVFDEELDTEVATSPDSYAVKRLSDNKEMPLSAEIDDSMRTVELRFSAELDDITDYQLLIKTYKDVYGNINASDYQYAFTTLDYKNPVVINDPEMDQCCFAIAEKGKIFIIYSEAMKEAQMLDKANYQVSINDGDKYTDLGDDDLITKVNDRKIQIYVKGLEDKNDSTIRPYVKIAPIMDLAGNRLYGSVEARIVESIDSENVYIEEAQLIAKNKIKVVFNKKMGNISGSDIELTNLTTPGSISVLSCEPPTITFNGKSEVVLILDQDLTTDVRDEAGQEIGITTIASPSSESESGSKLRSEYSTILSDKTAPEILKWDHDNDASTDDIAKVIAGGDIASPQVYDYAYTVRQDTIGIITIFFSEDIKESTLAENTFEVAGFTITDLTAPAEKTIILTVKANADNTPVKTTVTQVSELYDIPDNAFTQGSTWAVTLENSPSQ